MRKNLSKEQLENISKATFNKCNKIGLKHAKENIPYIKKTILDLEDRKKKEENCIVISAGPSLHRKDQAEKILRSGFKGTIVCADGSLYYCLRKGIVPDYVVSVDPHPTRIIRLFGDPELKSTPEDDYFRRQDLDPALNTDEIKRNNEVMGLVNKYGKDIKLIISTSITTKITQRCIDAGMDLYWWNPIYDDYDNENSFTKKLYELTKVPCMATGGNVGTSAWVFAASVLGAKNIALIGMDLSYPPGTPLCNTQYYHELREIFTDYEKDGFVEVYNPHLDQTWYTDPAYYWYRESFLELVKLTDSVIYNCTEGGILFGDGVVFTELDNFLQKF